jgi:hypothetical protein
MDATGAAAGELGNNTIYDFRTPRYPPGYAGGGKSLYVHILPIFFSRSVPGSDAPQKGVWNTQRKEIHRHRYLMYNIS